MTKPALLFLFLFGCASADVATPDAAVSTIPSKITGTYSIDGEIDLKTLPDPAIDVLTELSAATDSPDDPARYLIDRMIAAMPDGTWKSFAAGLADYVAPLLEVEIDKFAPNFAPGIRAMTQGLNGIAHHVSTVERITIAADGTATRALLGLRLANVPVEFASGGVADQLALTHAQIDSAGTLAVGSHEMALPYGEMLKLGLDRAVIPGIDFNAGDLASALRDLVDCHTLGTEFAAKAAIGTAGMYETACSAAMISIADGVYDRLAAIDANAFVFDVNGTASGVDLNGDGQMDRISDGVWAGSVSYAGVKGPIGVATFSGDRVVTP
ncbi:MAG: hypothetical protein QM831_31235 [Kofleriaceae bacterium]